MNRIFNLFLIVITSLFLVSSTNIIEKNESPISLITKQNKFIAGEKIKVTFENKSNVRPQLFIIHSYGKTLLDGYQKNSVITFILPQIFANKTGVLDWFLITKYRNVLRGSFEIIPKSSINPTIENYLGPQSTTVGNGNFITYITIPTDPYDNPMQENTVVNFKNHFNSSFYTQDIRSKDFIAWKKFFTPTRSGLMLFSASCKNSITKEYDATIFPGIATNFSITYFRNHKYADGNQITTLKTSKIKDKYGNIVSDGTMVTFFIKDKKNNPLKTFGTTKDGIATAQILHPDHKETYLIKAFVTGAGASNILNISYQPFETKIKYQFFDNNRTLIVGPINSFMNQIVPDGITITLKIYHKNKLIDTLKEESYDGKVTFTIYEDFYKEKKYWYKIEVLGTEIITEEKEYDNN